MQKVIVAQTAQSINLPARIAGFIAKLDTLDQKSKAYANAVAGEKRYLKKHYPAVRTYNQYLGKYREALGNSARFHHSYEANREKLIAKYPHLVSVLGVENVSETLLAVKLHKKNIGTMCAGEFDALTRLKIACVAFNSLRISSEDSAMIAHDDNAKIVAKKAQKTPVALQNIVRAVDTLLTAKSLYKHAIALSLSSGRRPIEIFKTGAFEYVSSTSVRFTGQAKDKGTGVRDSYEIPILFTTAKKFLKSFEAFREKTIAAGYHELTNPQVNNRLGSEMSRITRDVLECNGISFYTCRAIYARRAVDTLKRPEEDTQVYIASILGHGSNDVKTALSYESIFITTEIVERVKPVGVERVQPLGVKEVAPRRVNTKKDPRLSALAALAPEMTSKALAALHEWVVAHLTETPRATITQSYITKRRSTSRPVIVRYLEIIGDLACVEA